MTKSLRSKCPKCKTLREYMYETECPFCGSKWVKPKKNLTLRL